MDLEQVDKVVPELCETGIEGGKDRIASSQPIMRDLRHYKQVRPPKARRPNCRADGFLTLIHGGCVDMAVADPEGAFHNGARINSGHAIDFKTQPRNCHAVVSIKSIYVSRQTPLRLLCWRRHHAQCMPLLLLPKCPSGDHTVATGCRTQVCLDSVVWRPRDHIRPLRAVRRRAYSLASWQTRC